TSRKRAWSRCRKRRGGAGTGGRAWVRGGEASFRVDLVQVGWSSPLPTSKQQPRQGAALHSLGPGVDPADYFEYYGCYQRGCGDGQDPGPDDFSGDAPADCSQAVGGSHADNRTGDGVRGAHGNSCQSGCEQRDGSRCFGTEAAHRLQFGDARSHGVNDAPTAEVSSQSDGSMGGEDDGPVIVAPVVVHVVGA